MRRKHYPFGSIVQLWTEAYSSHREIQMAFNPNNGERAALSSGDPRRQARLPEDSGACRYLRTPSAGAGQADYHTERKDPAMKNPALLAAPNAATAAPAATISAAHQSRTLRVLTPTLPPRRAISRDRRFLRALRAAEMAVWNATGGDCLRTPAEI
jgi:hypothetical protein